MCIDSYGRIHKATQPYFTGPLQMDRVLGLLVFHRNVDRTFIEVFILWKLTGFPADLYAFQLPTEIHDNQRTVLERTRMYASNCKTFIEKVARLT